MWGPGHKEPQDNNPLMEGEARVGTCWSGFEELRVVAALTPWEKSQLPGQVSHLEVAVGRLWQSSKMG